MRLNNRARIIAEGINLDGVDMFGGKPRRSIPMRDPNGHPHNNGGKPGAGDGKGGDGDGDKDKNKSGDGSGDGDGGKGGDGDGDNKPDPKPVDVTKTKAYKDEKKRADDAEAELQKLREAGMNDDEKAREAEKKTAVTAAVSAKETELTDHYEGVVAGLQQQIIESVIDGVFEASPLDKKDFNDVLATLDTSRFINDDGSVDREKVKKTLAPITGAATSRPPRTGGGRTTARDNGFGRYLKQD
ncbi:head scaffolding protein [Gordonia phage Pleakley]|uniref:Scaffolding protein n=1 Tax=Gordonia phage Pleakley TaxID=2283246 RepID=A0A345M6F4_9CAUD|nr:head scaffolding protein [Gordonia phage Pleakley]AXH49762.1 scaffolding protein [Gordonia phage Fury]AXH66075.1 scaffolding protein [Gordonia phage Pleakley]